MQSRCRLIRLVILVLALLLVLAAWVSPSRALGPEGPEDPSGTEVPGEAEDPSGPTVTPTPFLSPRQEQPFLPENPSMADLGHQTWWGVCMACHGDAGQGLTDEWRSTAFGEDQNCWTAKCHGPSHPPEGFVFPRIVPPAWGPGTLKRFVTADELHAYLLAKMPWWDPGSLSDQQAWELTAFILQSTGALPAGMELDVERASLFPVHLPMQKTGDERGWGIVLLGLVGLAAVGLLAAASFKRSSNKPAMRPTFYHHLHPPTIPFVQSRLRYTLAAGGLAVFFSLVLLLTGILEMFFYVPTPEEAALSIQTITYLVPFGGLVRGIHFWAAQALVVIAVVHLLRVVFTGAFTKPRRLNYWIGVALLLLVLLLDFTGYVLRWDEGIRWALMVGTNLLRTVPLAGEGLYRFVVGGDSPGLAALTRFYAWHIFGLTLIMVVLVAWHIFRVRRDGGIAVPAPENRADSRRITRNELVGREVLAMLIAGTLLVLASVLLPTPIAPAIQDAPTALLADARAPWFFLWVQQMLRFGGAFWMGVFVPLAVLALLALLPVFFKEMPNEQRGRWLPPAARKASFILALVVFLWLVLTVLELRN